jgi:hypothetical protein
MILRTFSEILSNPWNNIQPRKITPQRMPFRSATTELSCIDDINLWEEIYYNSGTIGVYAAWDPYEDFYIIVHNLHLDKNYIETYTGSTAVDAIINRCQEFGIDLNISESFINQI